MTTDEALKLAIDALKDAFYEKADEAKTALVEPEWAELTRGEILSWEMPAASSVVEFVWFVERKIREKNESLPKRTWIGLTNDELTDLFYNTNLGQQSAVGQAIELLRERNT
jgi:hypothetical protein